MENELAFYISQGVVGDDKSVMDGRYEFYRDGRDHGLSSDDYRRLYFLNLLSAAADDPRSTSDLEADWFRAQGFERAEGFAAAYVGEADLIGEPPLPPEVLIAGPITSDPTPVSATVAMPMPGELSAEDYLVIAARSQNGILEDPMQITEYAGLCFYTQGGGRQTAFVTATGTVAPGPASVTVTRTSDTAARTVYAPLILKNVDMGSADAILAIDSGPMNWEGPLAAPVDDTLFLLIIGWENLADTDPIYGPSLGVMQGATQHIVGYTDGAPTVNRTALAVYSKLMPQGSYSMTDSDITVVSGTGNGSSPAAVLLAIRP